MSGAATATFVYGPAGERVKGTVNGGTTTLYIGNHYEKQGSTVRKYYYAGSQRVAMRENGTLYWLLTDHLGSTAITANGTSGEWVGEVRYKAWGEERPACAGPPCGTTPTTWRYTGQRAESGIGLYYYNARWYDAALARFVQADTVTPGAGNPQALNRYSYSFNRPLNLTDPTGHLPGPRGNPHNWDPQPPPRPQPLWQANIEGKDWSAGIYLAKGQNAPGWMSVATTTIDTTCLVASATALLLEGVAAVAGQAELVAAIEKGYQGLNIAENEASWGSTLITMAGDNAARNNNLRIDESGLDVSVGLDTLTSTVLSLAGQYLGVNPVSDTIINAVQVGYDFARGGGKLDTFRLGVHADVSIQ